MRTVLSGRVVVAMMLVLASVLVASPVRAQSATTNAEASRLSLTTTVGGTGIPDAIGAKCGRNGGGVAPALEGSAGVIARPWWRLVVQADARRARSPDIGCTLVLYSVDTSYTASGGGFPFMSATARVGVETPPSDALLRLTAGVGRLSGTPGRQFLVIGGAIGTRGRRHALLEIDYMRASLPAAEVRMGASPRPITVQPHWVSVRVGMEWGLLR